MERFVSISGQLTIPAVPGLFVRAEYYSDKSLTAFLTYSGTLGVRELNRLIEEATKLRDELSAAIG